MGAEVSTVESSSVDSPSTQTGAESTSAGGAHGLAGTTYEEGQAALSPRKAAGPSAAQLALQDDLEWFGDQRRVGKRKGATSALQILESLSELDTPSITAVCSQASARNSAGFERFIRALGWSGTRGQGAFRARESVSVIQRYPRETRAVLSTAPPELLVEVAEDWNRSNPTASAVALAVVPPEAVPDDVVTPTLSEEEQRTVATSSEEGTDKVKAAAASPELVVFMEHLELDATPNVRQAIAADTLCKSPGAAVSLYHGLQELTPKDREHLRTAYPGLFEHVENKLPPEVRMAGDTNFFASGDAESVKSQRDDLETELCGLTLWTTECAERLESTVRLAVSMGLREVVTRRLGELDGDGALATLVADEARRLAVERGLRTTTTVTDPAGWLEQLEAGVTVGNGSNDDWFGTTIGSLLRGVSSRRHREHDGPETVLENVNLAKIDGFAEKGGAYADVRDVGRERTKEGELINRADIVVGQRRGGYLHIAIPQLELDAFRYPFGDYIVETGAVVAVGLDVVATWPTESQPGEPARAVVKAKSFTLSGVSITGPAFAASVNHLSFERFRYVAGDGEVALPTNGSATPDIQRLLSDVNPGRLVISSAWAGYVNRLNNPEYLDGQAALIDAFSGVAASGLGGLGLHLENLKVTGVAVGGGAWVGGAGATSIDVLQDSRPSVVGAARLGSLQSMVEEGQASLAKPMSEGDKASLEARIAAWTSEKKALEAALPRYRALESWLASASAASRLQSPDAADPGLNDRLLDDARTAGIDVPEDATLASVTAAVQAELSRGASRNLAVLGANASDIDVDGVTAKTVSLGPIGARNGPDIIAGVYSAAASSGLPLGDFLGGGTPVRVSLDVGSVTATGVAISGGVAQVEALAKLSAKREALLAARAAGPLRKSDEATLEGVEATWSRVLADGRTYGEVADALLALVAAAGGYDAARQDAAYRGELDALEQALATSPMKIDSVSLLGLDVDLAGTMTDDGVRGLSTVETGPVSLNDINVGGAHVASLGTSSVSATVGVNTVESEEAYAINARTADIVVGEVDAGGVHLPGATIGGLTAKGTVDRSETDLWLGVGTSTLSGTDVTSRLEQARARILALEGMESRTADLDAELAALRSGLASYEQALRDVAGVEATLRDYDRAIVAAEQTAAGAAKLDAVTYAGDLDLEREAESDADAARASVADLKAARAEAAKALTAPAAIVADYESHGGLAGATIGASSVHVTGDGLEAWRSGEGTWSFDLVLGTLDVPAFSYATPDLTLRGGKSSLESVTGEVDVTRSKVDGETTAKIHVKRLGSPKLATEDFVVQTGALELRLPSASIQELRITELNIDFADEDWDKHLSGSLRTGAIAAEVGASLKEGMALSASTTLRASGLHATALSSGAVTFGLDDLMALDPKLGAEWAAANGDGGFVSQVIGLGGSVRALNGLGVSGKYDRASGRLTTTVSLGELDVRNVHWTDGADTLALDSARALGTRATVRVETGTGGSEVWLDTFHIDSAVAKKLRYDGTDAVTTMYRNGSEVETRSETMVRMPWGSVVGLDLAKSVELTAKTLDLGLSAESADLTDLLLQQKMQTGQMRSLLVAEASGLCTGLKIGYIGNDLSVGIDKGKGNFELGGVSDGQAWYFGSTDVNADDASVNVKDVGRANQSASMVVNSLDVRHLTFGKDIAPKGFVFPLRGLAGAHLQGVRADFGPERMHVHVDSGWGQAIIDHELSDVQSGTFDPRGHDPDQQRQDEMVLPLYHTNYSITALDMVTGDIDVNLPGGVPVFSLRFTNGKMEFDFSRNTEALWKSLEDQLLASGRSGVTKDVIEIVKKMGLEDPLLQLIEPLATELSETFLPYANLGTLVENWLNGPLQRAEVAEASPFSQEGLTDLVNRVIEENLVSLALEGGMGYDVLVGRNDRALVTLASYFAEAAGDAADSVTGTNYTDLDEKAQFVRDYADSARRSEVENFTAALLEWTSQFGLSLNLSSEGGRIEGTKTPVEGMLAPPLRDPVVLSSGLDLKLFGQGSFAAGLGVGAQATLTGFRMGDAGSTLGIDRLAVTAGTTEQLTTTPGQGGTFDYVNLRGRGGVAVNFEGLDYELVPMDDSPYWDVETTEDQKATTGSNRPNPGMGTFDGTSARFLADSHSKDLVEAYNAKLERAYPAQE